MFNAHSSEFPYCDGNLIGAMLAHLIGTYISTAALTYKKFDFVVHAKPLTLISLPIMSCGRTSRDLFKT